MISVRLRNGPRPDSNSLTRARTVGGLLHATLRRCNARHHILRKQMTSTPHYEVLPRRSVEEMINNYFMILGDLNAKVGSARPASGGAVGCFSKHVSSNANGERLIELCEEQNLILCNTMFKHRMQHRSTWFSDGLVHRDGQPVRNMIDFVIMRRSNTVRVVNARSYGGFTIRSDHHLVIADFRLTFWRCTTLYYKATNYRCFIKYNRPTQDSAESFKNAIASTLPDINTPPEDISTLDQTWERFVSSTHAAAEKAFGRKKPQKRIARSTSPAVIELSTQQKEIHSRIHMEKDPNKRKDLTCMYVYVYFI